MVFSYSDQIIVELIDKLGITDDDLILDPFNGTGTTTLTAKKEGIDSIGTDANPFAVLVGKCKTNWDVEVQKIQQRSEDLIEEVRPAIAAIERREGSLGIDHEYGNAVDLSMYDFGELPKVPEGWLSEVPRMKMIVLRHHIERFPNDAVTSLLRLSMCAILPEDVANVSFGPEAYKSGANDDAPVIELFESKIEQIITDLQSVQNAVNRGEITPGRTEIFNADARKIRTELENKSELLTKSPHGGSVDYVITSPPYPAEHDYVRNQRLELVWMGEITDNSDLQRIKKSNIRSNTKNIYVDDSEGREMDIRSNDNIDDIVGEMENIIEVEQIEHGFGQYYPRVVEEYFAGMLKHLIQIHKILTPGGKAAYVVADSGSYWQIDIPTSTILSELAENRAGFEQSEILHWRDIFSSTGKKNLREEILLLEKPNEL